MGVIEIKGLHKSYGKVKAVNGVDLEIRKGEVFGLLGPNGSGKTTVIKIMCGLLKPDKGSVTILGNDVKNRGYLKLIGYMPQETALYEDLTIHENIKMFGGIHEMKKEEVQNRENEVLSMVDLLDRKDFLLSSLSGGQRHRVSLAVSMVHSPELLFLDEPTVGVDPPLRSNFWSTFHEIKKSGRTIVMSTHYMDEALNCDRIGMMRNGGMIALGTPAEIMERTGTKTLENAFLFLARGVDR